MRTFTKIFLVTVLGLFCLNLSAQTIGIKAGLSMSNILAKDDDDTYSDDYKMKPGFHVGATVDIPITDMFSFQTGLLLNSKGPMFKDEEDGVKYKSKLNLTYIDIPLNVLANFELTDGVKAFGALGPYVGIGLTGKSKTTVEMEGNKKTEKESIKWGSDEEKDDYKRLDLGLTIGAGVEVSSITAGIFYDLGLANISPYSSNGYRQNNRVLRLTLGYKIGK